MDLTDEALVEKFWQTKDSAFFQSLVRRYQGRLFNAAYRILGNTDEAEEVVQETYIRVHQNLARFRKECSFKSWIFKIAHNMCVDVLRTNKRRGGFQLLIFDPKSTHNEGDCPDGTHSVISQLADNGPSPEQVLEVNEQSKVIEASLSELPEHQRTVVVLHDIEGLSYQEIADIVGTNLGTVRSRLHYGRLKLRQLLDGYFSNESLSPIPR